MRMPLFIAAVLLAAGTAHAQDKLPVIAVFPFELEDKSAGGGIIAADERDMRYLRDSTEQAKSMLRHTNRFRVVDGRSTPDATPYGLRNCDGCESRLARESGANFAMVGVVTRVNRTEHTLFIRVLEAGSGKPVSRGFTNLRMGANYAWPRSVKWLMDNQILAAARASN